MKKIIELYKSRSIKNKKLALVLFDSLTDYQCIRFMLEMGWDSSILKELMKKEWFTSWQFQAKELFKYLDKSKFNFWR